MENPGFDELMHYGTKRHSGRYPWGSGDNPYQHEANFLKEVYDKRDANFEYTDDDGKTYTGDLAIAKSMGLTTTQFRTRLALSNNRVRRAEVERVKQLREEGKSLNEIAEIMGYNNDSSIRSLLNENSEARMNVAEKTAEFLKKQVDEKGMIDVGIGVERELGLSSREKLKEALYILEMEGYPVYPVGVPQVTNPGKQINTKILCPPGTPHKDAYNFGDIHSATEDWVSHDGGQTFDPRFVKPKSIDSKRIGVRYGEEGAKKEGVIELRRGVKDIDLGGSHYAQVRILVDGTHYIKGMAVYADDDELPPGVDILVNSKKSSDVPLIGPKNNSILKPVKDDPNNPFGALIKEGIDDPDVGTKGGGQRYYIDDYGKKQLSVINKTREEGDWMEWSDTLPSQFLAKQPQKLIDRQLTIAKNDKKSEFDEIMALNNPVVKKKYLKDFADDCDAAAVHLKAAALPRQKYQVLMPLTTIKEDEVYAPNYHNGEKVALIRYPHGGTFEIPILTVNNKNAEGERVYGKQPKDIVGVDKKVADRLSGADFDGDTVMVIPCNSSSSSVNIVSTKLKEIEGFDDQMEYGGRPDGSFKKLSKAQQQIEMGKVSNLITDMTLKGAKDDEIARAVKHSMVVIDAEKHSLDYKASEKDFGIQELKRKYQGREENGKYTEGAATLISRASGQKHVLKRKGSPVIDPETGKQTYKTALTQEEAEKAAKLMSSGKSVEEIATIINKKPSEVSSMVYKKYDKKTGKSSIEIRTQESTQMAEVDDAYILSTGTPQENAYADYANYMKELANEARRSMVNTKNPLYSPEAKATYSNEVASLNAKLNVAKKNAPRERRAQAMANAIVAEKKKLYPDLILPENKKDLKKVKQQALVEARTKMGAKRDPFTITDKEWEAIQSGAVSANKLAEIVNYMDADTLRDYATPKHNRGLSGAKQAKIHSLVASGFTPAEIASMLNISTTTVHKYME